MAKLKVFQNISKNKNNTVENLIKKVLMAEKNNFEDEVLKILEKLYSIDSKNIWVMGKLILKYGELSEYEKVIPIAKKVIEILPSNEQYFGLLGEALIKTDKLDPAEFLIDEMERRFQKSRAILILKSNLASAKQDFDLALKYALEMVSFDPSWPGAYNNLGSSLCDKGMYKEGAIAFETCLNLDPQSIDARSNLAFAYAKDGNHEQAIEVYEDALLKCQANPSSKIEPIKFALSFEYLSVGNLEKGWEYYDSGFSKDVRAFARRQPERKFKCKFWRGEPLRNKRLLVWREQGVGDEFMFMSVINELMALEHERVIIECDARLISTVQRSFPKALVRAQSFDSNTLMGVEDYDYHIPIGSLVGLFRRNLDDFKRAQPYIVPNEKDVHEVVEHFSKNFPKKLNVGLSWRSGVLSTIRNQHYTNLSDWTELLIHPEINIINLQYGDAEAEIKAAEQALNIKIHRWTDLDLKNDFEGTFALLKSLDVVVTVGTAVAAMAPAVGVPTILLGQLGWDSLGTGGWPWLPNVRYHATSVGRPVAELIPECVAEIGHMIEKKAENKFIV